MTTPIIDLRSDTVTRPTLAMKAAMTAAPLGDDVFGDDPSVNALQERVAALAGKERALFVPSGTMSNQLALRAQTRPGDEIICHRGCHIFNYESGAAAALAGVQLRTFDTTDGSLPLDEVHASIHQTDDPHFAPTTLIAFENTHNGCGGVVAPQQNLKAVCDLAHERGIRTHLDGARLFNAANAAGTGLRALAEPFDTVSLCFSKGLGAPVGSVLCGDAQTIARAHRFRKMYGGGMRQAGVLAAAALYALDHHVERLSDDHRRARHLAGAIDACPPLRVDLSRVHTNIIYFEAEGALSETDEAGRPAIMRKLWDLGIRIVGGPHRLRAVTHLDIDDSAIERAAAAFRHVAAGAAG